VEENIEDMKHFIHNASHELKTPLSVMRWNLQIIQAEKKYDESLILSSIENVDKMNGLIEWLRELSEVGKLKQQEFLALTTIVDDVIWQYKDNIEKKSLLLITQLNSNYSLRANKQELSMLIANILGNAIKYSQEKWEINVGVKKNILEISDHGPGMTKIEQEKVFDRFYQGSTWRNAEWFGIGLSLVRKIADSNNWKIELDSEEKKWTTFRILF
jgi:signal transduction histidine kinase